MGQLWRSQDRRLEQVVPTPEQAVHTSAKAAQVVRVCVGAAAGGLQQGQCVVLAHGQRCALRSRLGLAGDEVQKGQPGLPLAARACPGS